MNRLLFYLIIFSFTFSLNLVAQTNFEKPYEATLPFYDGETYLGDILVEIKGEEIVWVERETLKSFFKNILKEDTLNSLEKLPSKVSPTRLPFPIKLNAEELRIESTLSLNYRATQNTDLRENYLPNRSEALTPAPFGGAINYRLEQFYGSEKLGGNNFNGQFNSFTNIQSIVLENQSFYQTQTEQKWFRGDTRLVKDFEKNQIRTQVGDVYPQIQGFMAGRSLGGINIHRNFSLNPYRLPYPTGSQNFTIKSRSLVKYFVNSILVKTEYLPAGNYNAKDIPLNNGLNTILIEATDDLGQKQFFVFRSVASINLLNKGESRFDLSYGTRFVDNNLKRDYLASEGNIFSGFYQYGFSSEFSASAYLQNQNNFNLMGSEAIYATVFGNFSFGHAQSIFGSENGNANSLSYQFISQGEQWLASQSISLRYENRSQNFKTTQFDSMSAVQNTYAGNYTLPLSNLMTISFGANYGDVRDNSLNNRYGYDTTISFRIFNHHNISFFTGRTRDEYKRWNDVAYLFLTITFPETNNFLSTFYDEQKKSTRVTYLRDNQNRLRTVRAQGTFENDQTQQLGELDMLYPTPFADFGGRMNSSRNYANHSVDGRGSLRLNSAFVFAYQNKQWGVGISRPVPGSFVIFKPEPRLKGQKIALKSTSPYTEAETGLFNEITFNNLLAYQYRDIQLDPTLLDPGISLQKEKFTLYPTYRSAHLITLEERGSVILTGRIINAQGRPLALKVGKIGNNTFFTNRDGVFFIEGLEAGQYKLELEDIDQKIMIQINKDERGFKELGNLRLKE
ncbi:MAG: hypothetical protein AB7I27_19035 [Bacteriovoracaceae bacterium]